MLLRVDLLRTFGSGPTADHPPLAISASLQTNGPIPVIAVTHWALVAVIVLVLAVFVVAAVINRQPRDIRRARRRHPSTRPSPTGLHLMDVHSSRGRDGHRPSDRPAPGGPRERNIA